MDIRSSRSALSILIRIVSTCTIMTAVSGCEDKSDDARELAMLETNGVEDSEASLVLQRHRALLLGLSGSAPVAPYIATDVHLFGIGTLDSVHVVGTQSSRVDSSASLDYWAIAKIRVPLGDHPIRAAFVRERIAGTPAGIKTIGEIQGHPFIIVWSSRNESWVASSIQIYPPSELADSLSLRLRQIY